MILGPRPYWTNYALEGYSVRVARLLAARDIALARAARAGRVTRRGWRYGYPACCIARFAFDVLRDASPGELRGWPECEWVPCGVLHRAPTVGR